MAYIGGKSKANWLYQFLNHKRFDGLAYIEPFVGMANVLMNIKEKASYTASDSEPFLFNLLQNIQLNCFDYPFITKEEYLDLRRDPYSDYDKACFAAYTYSSLGKIWGSYFDARYKQRVNRYQRLHDSISFRAAKITHTDYKAYSDAHNSIIYCDPPYQGTYSYKQEFCHEGFWEWIRHMSVNNYVFVSEYKAPDDMVNIYQKRQMVSFMKNKGQMRTEKLFVCNEDLIDLFSEKVNFYRDYNHPEQLSLMI